MGFVLDAVGQIKQGKEDAKTGKINAASLEAQAVDATLRGTVEESRYRRQIAQTIGAQKAVMGQRNVAASGTALDLLSDTAMIGEEDAMTIRNNASREAWGLRNDAKESLRWGKNQKKQSLLGAGSTLLTGAAQSSGMWSTG